jgi:hypothetical protein
LAEGVRVPTVGINCNRPGEIGQQDRDQEFIAQNYLKLFRVIVYIVILAGVPYSESFWIGLWITGTEIERQPTRVSNAAKIHAYQLSKEVSKIIKEFVITFIPFVIRRTEIEEIAIWVALGCDFGDVRNVNCKDRFKPLL